MTITILEKEKDILAAAIKAVEEAGIRLQIEQEQVRVEGQEVDAVLAMEGVPGKFVAEIKKWAPHANLDALIYQIYRLPVHAGRGMLVADFVNPKMAERLKAEGIPFIDTMGNAYINIPPNYVYVKGQGKAQKGTAPKGNRAFEPMGLKVIFALLCDPELVNAPYRTIANKADVALGTVGWVITGLKNVGLLIDKGKNNGRRITNYQKLLDKWVEDYPQKLRPKLKVGTFAAKDPRWWDGLDITQYGAQWGGETAGARLTGHLKPKVATLYLPEKEQNALFAKAQFHKIDDPHANNQALVHVYRPFWQHEEPGLQHTSVAPDLVPPVLIYADLIATGDRRNRETAEIIYENYIAQHLGKA